MVTNYENLAGTSLKLARTLVRVSECCGGISHVRQCNKCPLLKAPCGQQRRLSKWLQEETNG